LFTNFNVNIAFKGIIVTFVIAKFQEMLDRILAILNYLKMSPSRFAEEIGVQRSSISHLVSGRNKPSLEFIQKLLVRFPEIDPGWLVSGQGEMLKNRDTVPGSPAEPIEVPKSADEIAATNVKSEVSRSPGRRKNTVPGENPVEKVVYFYRDNTFREYFPGKED
jgi:transcriptional regulator with XRE-family HTH domain